jgi:hypothetical protein
LQNVRLAKEQEDERERRLKGEEVERRKRMATTFRR